MATSSSFRIVEKNTFLEVCFAEDVVQPTRRRSRSCGDSWPEIASLPKKPGLIKGNRTKHEDSDLVAKATNEEDYQVTKAETEEGDQAAKAKNEEDHRVAKARQHDDGTCKPCLFFASSVGCTRSKCSYCHLTHTPPSGKRPKKQIREMNKAAVQKAFETVQESERLWQADPKIEADLVKDLPWRIFLGAQIEAHCDRYKYAMHTSRSWQKGHISESPPEESPRVSGERLFGLNGCKTSGSSCDLIAGAKPIGPIGQATEEPSFDRVLELVKPAWSNTDVVQPTRRRSWSCGDSWPEIAISLPKKHEEGYLVAKTRNEESDQVAKAKNEEDHQVAKAQQHGDGTCKPCVFFASSAGCTRSKCSYCHLTHTPPSGKRPKKQIREMSKAAVQKAFETVQESEWFLAEPDALHAALQELAQDRYCRLLIIGRIDSMLPGGRRVVANIPGNISKRFQQTAEGFSVAIASLVALKAADEATLVCQFRVEKTVTGIIELPDRLSKGATRASEAVVNTGEAIAKFPGRVQVENFVTGVSNAVENVVTLPERTAKTVDNTVTGVTRTAEAIVSFPGRVKETADSVVGGVTSTVDSVTSVPKKVDSVVSVPGKVKESVDSVVSIPGKVKSSVDGVIETGQNVVGAVSGAASFVMSGVSAVAWAAQSLADLVKGQEDAPPKAAPPAPAAPKAPAAKASPEATKAAAEDSKAGNVELQRVEMLHVGLLRSILHPMLGFSMLVGTMLEVCPEVLLC
eukprot:Skav232820  [mRNA]  locus=scaffold614:630894:648674:- [translate_table: standard]